MSIVVRNGVSYDTEDLRNYGAYDIVTAGTGDKQELFVAIMTDSIADAGKSLVTTSTTSLTIGTGTKIWVLDADIPMFPGLRVTVVDVADAANKMHGEVTDYVSGTKTATVSVDKTEGSGTIADWDFKGGVGANGATGGLAAVVDDVTPQSGGAWDVNGKQFITVSDGDMEFAPDGSGDFNVILGTGVMDIQGDTKAKRGIVTEAGTSKTFGLSDRNTFQNFTNGAAVTVTVPPNSSVAFPVGTEIDLYQSGAGQVTMLAGGGVTINSKGALLAFAAQFVGASLKKTASDTWELVGDLA